MHCNEKICGIPDVQPDGAGFFIRGWLTGDNYSDFLEKNIMDENSIIEEHNGVQVIKMHGGYCLFCDGKNYFKKVYDEITFNPFDRCFMCRKSRSYDSFFVDTMSSGSSSYCMKMSDDDEIYYNGKFGLYIDGKEILPPIYDDIIRWNIGEVIYTRRAMEIKYFDLQGNEILRNRREIKDAADYLEPYYCGEPQNTNVVQTLDSCEFPVGDDCCRCFGKRVALSRRTRQEHMDWIKKQSTGACKIFRNNTLFASDCYIYSAYMIQSERNAGNPLGNCFRQLEKIADLESGWNITLLILYPQKGFQHRITKEELKSIREMQYRVSGRSYRGDKCQKKQDRIACGKADTITVDAIYKGVTDRIESGVIVLTTLCFADHWPTQEEYKKWEEKGKRMQRKRRSRNKYLKG